MCLLSLLYPILKNKQLHYIFLLHTVFWGRMDGNNNYSVRTYHTYVIQFGVAKIF